MTDPAAAAAAPGGAMKTIVKAFIGGLSALCVAIALPADGRAQSFPNKPVRVVVPYPAGGQSDVITRAITTELSKMWGVPVLVENKPGASGNIATESVFRLPADGYTILHADNGTWFTNDLRKVKPPYDLSKDFVPVIGSIASGFTLAVRNSLPVNNAKELIAYLKANPNAKYSSYGIASINHVGMEGLLRQAGVTATHVPYQGGVPALRALGGDEVDFALNGTNSVPFLQEGKARAIAVTSEKRWSTLPNVPTLTESGVPFVMRAWFVFVVPAATPAPILAKLSEDIGKVTAGDEFRQKFLEPNAWDNLPLTGKQMSDLIAADRKEFETRVTPLNLQVD